mmetsp:Transcript_15942/g.24657  ORF Transcript_15942/g.24657 Transcript_15942/m.24657 type:complete len:404 (+) Transcript_15942:911-2122(+)
MVLNMRFQLCIQLLLRPHLQLVHFKPSRDSIDLVNNEDDSVSALVDKFENFVNRAAFEIGDVQDIHDNGSIVDLLEQIADDPFAVELHDLGGKSGQVHSLTSSQARARLLFILQFLVEEAVLHFEDVAPVAEEGVHWGLLLRFVLLVDLVHLLVGEEGLVLDGLHALSGFILELVMELVKLHDRAQVVDFQAVLETGAALAVLGLVAELLVATQLFEDFLSGAHLAELLDEVLIGLRAFEVIKEVSVSLFESLNFLEALLQLVLRDVAEAVFIVYLQRDSTARAVVAHEAGIVFGNNLWVLRLDNWLESSCDLFLLKLVQRGQRVFDLLLELLCGEPVEMGVIDIRIQVIIFLLLCFRSHHRRLLSFQFPEVKERVLVVTLTAAGEGTERHPQEAASNYRSCV